MESVMSLLGIYWSTGLWVLHLALGITLLMLAYNTIFRLLETLKVVLNKNWVFKFKHFSYKKLVYINLFLLALHNLIYAGEIFNNFMFMLVVFGTTILAQTPIILGMTLYTLYFPAKVNTNETEKDPRLRLNNIFVLITNFLVVLCWLVLNLFFILQLWSAVTEL